jgi:nucleotide-binding universal stress UspA family protein
MVSDSYPHPAHRRSAPSATSGAALPLGSTVKSRASTIVCGVDRSTEARAAARLAAALARRLGLRLELLHVCRPTAKPEAGVISSVQRVVQQELDREAVEVLIESGSVPERLIEATHDAALLVVGRRAHGAIRQTLFGSVSAAVTRAPSSPVVVVPPSAAARAGVPPLHGTTIACGVRDRRDIPCAATAARLASELGLPLTVMHVLTPPHVPGVTAAEAAPVAVPPSPDETSESAVRAAERLDGWLAEVPAKSREVRLLSGPPGSELAHAAAAENAALIVIGASHHGPLAGALLGAASSQLLRDADRPVMVCPRPLPGQA